MRIARLPLLACTLLAAFALLAPCSHAQTGRWNQAFRNTGSQAMKRPSPPQINTSPVHSPFDLSGQTANFSWSGYPCLHPPLIASPWPIYPNPGILVYPGFQPHYSPWHTPFPILQSFSFQSFSLQVTSPLPLPAAPTQISKPNTALNPEQPLLLPAAIPLAFDPADPRLLNFTPPPAAAKPPKSLPAGLPGVAAQPVPVNSEQGIVLRGKPKLADGRKN